MNSPSSPRRLGRWAIFPAAAALLVIGAAVAWGASRTSDAPAPSVTVAGDAAPAERTLTIGAYTTPREVYGREILPAFAKMWKAKTGQTLTFEESYLGSGAQARAVIGGFEADVVALSLDPDVESVAKAKLITHDWRAKANGGMVSRSIVVLAVRPGNPKGIKDWEDLRRPGIKVLTPSPKTSGGAMWNISALYGAAVRGATSRAKGDSVAAEQLVREVIANVSIMDKGARESMITFENGVGDVAITYENEVLVSRKSGNKIDYVIPKGTILIENPVAVVDVYADKHKNRDLAEAFVAFLATPDAQRAYSAYGLRAVDAAVAQATSAAYPAVPGLFTIRDLGGWPAVTKSLFAPGGAFERATRATASAK